MSGQSYDMPAPTFIVGDVVEIAQLQSAPEPDLDNGMRGVVTNIREYMKNNNKYTYMVTLLSGYEYEMEGSELVKL